MVILKSPHHERLAKRSIASDGWREAWGWLRGWVSAEWPTILHENFVQHMTFLARKGFSPLGPRSGGVAETLPF
jgi:hypothetical protein